MVCCEIFLCKKKYHVVKMSYNIFSIYISIVRLDNMFSIVARDIPAARWTG